MTKVKTNPIITGLSGKLGDLVFSQRGDRIIMGKAPLNNSEPTEKQLLHRERFVKAAGYAKAQLKNADAKALYAAMAKRKGHDSAFAAAITDFFGVPNITEVIVNGYTGNIGNLIHVHVMDDTSIVSVKVEIVAADGSVVESGDAIAHESELFWSYESKVANPSFQDCKVKVTVTDRPGNSTMTEVGI